MKYTKYWQLTVDKFLRSCVAAWLLKTQPVAAQHCTDTSEFFPSLIRGGAVLFLLICATLRSIGGSVVMVCQAIGRSHLNHLVAVG